MFYLYSLQFNCTEVCPPHKNHHVESDDINDEGLIVCADINHPMVKARMMANREYVTQYIFITHKLQFCINNILILKNIVHYTGVKTIMNKIIKNRIWKQANFCNFDFYKNIFNIDSL